MGMGLGELLLLSVSLAMDAFAVSVCKGLAAPRLRARDALTAGLWFGAFQALMPLLGYLLGRQFASYIERIDHWIAFLLLALIGGNMVREALSGEQESVDCSYAAQQMLPLAVATSIDALAVGVTFAFLDVAILPAVTMIGVVTFVISAVGVVIGSVVGNRFSAKAELCGGIVLIVIGGRILLSHLGVIG